jgi:hypothetical protein
MAMSQERIEPVVEEDALPCPAVSSHRLITCHIKRYLMQKRVDNMQSAKYWVKLGETPLTRTLLYSRLSRRGSLVHSSSHHREDH